MKILLVILLNFFLSIGMCYSQVNINNIKIASTLVSVDASTPNNPNSYTWSEINNTKQGVHINVVPPEKAAIYLQQNSSTNQRENEKEKNLIFGEAAGNGLALSINYERYLTKNISARIGYGFFSIPVTLWFHSLPLLINYNFDKPFELGIGTVLYSTTTSGKGAGYFGEKKDGILITTTIGFKRINKNVVARVSLTPFYNIQDSKIKLYGGISFGITF